MQDETLKQLDHSLGSAIAKLGLSPNVWTSLAFIAAAGTGGLLAAGAFELGAELLLIALALSFVDGAVARVTRKVSVSGAYFDSLANFYIEFFAIAGLFFAALPSMLLTSQQWLFLLLFGMLSTSFAESLARETGLIGNEDLNFLLRRSERVLLLLLAVFYATVNAEFGVALLAIAAVFSVLTSVQVQIKSVLMHLWSSEAAHDQK